jgi:hypothetical protein
MHMFEYMQTSPAYLQLFRASARECTAPAIQAFLENYHDGLVSVHKLVDVGGSSGQLLSHVVQKHPHIHGVNFDLPEVVADNPNIPGKCLIYYTVKRSKLDKKKEMKQQKKQIQIEAITHFPKSECYDSRRSYVSRGGGEVALALVWYLVSNS